jgi:hypothetical protein
MKFLVFLQLTNAMMAYQELSVRNATLILTVVFTGYLPPENSNRGRNVKGFLAHLSSKEWKNNENINISAFADMNCRIE